MFAVAGVARALGAAASASSRVVRAATGAVTVLGSAGALAVGATAGAFSVVLGAASRAVGAAGALSLGAAASALGAGAPLGACLVPWGSGSAGARSGPVVSLEAVLGVRSAPSARTFFPGRATGPAPSAVAARTVVRAVGPATAAVGIPSSFGTHVVLDCLSRPLGLTIPWWKRGSVPLGDR